MKKVSWLLMVFMGLYLSGNAEVKPNSLFSDNMVLQCGVAVPVWGRADEGEEVTVEFAGQFLSAVAQNGKWMVKLNPLKVSNIPQEMKISGKNIVVVKNILVGEVWVCSGQSNMERPLGLHPPLKPVLNWQAEAKDAINYPHIRQFVVPRLTTDMKVETIKGKWVICDTSSVISFSAVGYFFARSLTKQLKVPIGLLFSSWPGTAAEKWTSRVAMENNLELKSIVEKYDQSLLDFPALLAKYKLNEDSLLAKWVSDTISAHIANKPIPKKPIAPIEPKKSGECGGLFNGMIAPLIPYAIKGVIWYQGESNQSNAKQYQTLFPAMITDWRKCWNSGDFPFLFVQIAPYKFMNPEIREAQLISWQKTPNTAMTVIVDCGDSADIHPADKKTVGERLALAARALAYNQKVAYSGPIYKSMEVKGNTIELSFDFVNKGLMVQGDRLTDFVIAGEDKKFVPANAIIKGNKIIVSSEKIQSPVAVRMGWANVPHINLFNLDGLPASPFRTDIDSASK